MELIQIIYTILLFGGVLLLLVVLFSFVLSKVRAAEESKQLNPEPERIIKTDITQQKRNYEQFLLRKNEVPRKDHFAANPVIFPIDQFKQRELNIVRKPTFKTRTESSESELKKETNGNGNRYTIVNDEIKKSRNKAVSFYL